jgi:hypothetical protein
MSFWKWSRTAAGNATADGFTKDATHPCAGRSDTTDCGHGNIAIGISSGASNGFAPRDE